MGSRRHLRRGVLGIYGFGASALVDLAQNRVKGAAVLVFSPASS
ncbi:MAG: hypothetical protein ACYCST_05645 [Acidimicrobiales bacterium]